MSDWVTMQKIVTNHTVDNPGANTGANAGYTLHLCWFKLRILENRSECLDLLWSHNTRIKVEHVVEKSLGIFCKRLKVLPFVILEFTFHDNQQSFSYEHKLCWRIRH